MQQRLIGNAHVGALGLGGAQWSLSDDRDDRAAERLIRLAIDNGVTYIDTASAYRTTDQLSHNEALIERALRTVKTDVVVGTKGGHYRDGNSWPIDGRPETIRAHCDASLAALRVDSLDLYYLHKPDPAVPFEVSVGALEDLRLDGKVRRTGVSNVSLDQFEAALNITPLSAIQNNFSPFRTSDLALIRACSAESVAYTAFSPLGGVNRPTNLRVALPRVAVLAHHRGQSVESVVLAWELSISSAVIPVVGAGRPNTLLDCLSAAELVIDDSLTEAIRQDLDALDASKQPSAGT